MALNLIFYCDRTEGHIFHWISWSWTLWIQKTLIELTNWKVYNLIKKHLFTYLHAIFQEI